MKYWKRLVRWCSSVATLSLAVLAAYSIACAYQESRGGEAFFILGYKPIIILSDSMEPTMPEGSLALVKKQEGKKAEIGDVVMFETDMFGSRAYVTHRIVAQDEEGFITKGDHNKVADAEYLDAEKIRGKVIFVCDLLKRKGGKSD